MEVEYYELKKDLESGKLQATVTMDGQKLDAAYGRKMAFTGPLSS